MSTVNSMLLQLALRVDPTVKSSGAIFGTDTVGSVDGDKFSKQRLLDVYNQARTTFFSAMQKLVPSSQFAFVLSSLIEPAEITWAKDGQVSTAPKPTGYVGFISMTNAIGTVLRLLPATKIETILAGGNPEYAQNSLQIFIFEVGTKFWHYGGFIGNAEVSTLRYYKLGNWVLADVTDLTKFEIFPLLYEPILLEVAEQISLGMGNADAMQLAVGLLGNKGQ